jgi:hypothetical protein
MNTPEVLEVGKFSSNRRRRPSRNAMIKLTSASTAPSNGKNGA